MERAGRPRIFISSTGTSLANNYKLGKEIEKLKSYDTTEWGDTEAIRKRIKKKLFDRIQLENREARKGLIPNCAETSTIGKLDLDPARDQVVLLASDTVDGRFCAEMVQQLTTEFLGWDVRIYVIKDLQVDDNRRFERYGIRNYIERIIALYDKYFNIKEIVLIPTGGFKGVVPYTTLLGMIYKLKMYYIFEDRKTVIKLPWLPIDFAYEPMEEMEGKFLLIDENSAIKSELFWDGIDYYDRNVYRPFIFEEFGEVTLSNIGLLLWENYKKDFPPELIKDHTTPEKKVINLHGDHHGNDKLKKMARKLNNSPYVKGITNSTEYRPYEREAINNVAEDGSFNYTLTDTDAGYSMIVQTTGRNLKETRKIAQLLNNKHVQIL